MKILSILILPVVTFATTVTVNTQTGTVIGSTVHYKGKSVKSFLGIPFAEPPVGNLRFKKTLPVQPWSEPLLADTFSPSCIQYYPFQYPWDDKMPGSSEDCLYLNIWVPESYFQGDPKPVMFWIHSGGFSAGSTRLPVYDGYLLAAEGNVIVVTINYRLGIFGFLSTDTDEAPGNMGLLDVVEALKWINNNIEAFGGDKDRITVFGHSSGAIIAGYLTVSPLSAGLFQRVIMESGSPTIMGHAMKQNLQLGEKVAKAVGCASELVTLKENPGKVVACLREIMPEILVRVVNHFKPTSIKTFVPIFGDAFMPVDPRKEILSGNFHKVDVLAGNVKDEGSVLLVTAITELTGPYGQHDPKINKTLGTSIISKVFKSLEFIHGNDVANYYLSDVDDDDYDAIRTQVYHADGDFELVCPTLYFVESFAPKVNHTYYYFFHHQSDITVFSSWMGTTHFSEVPFVFGRPLDNPSIYTEAEAELSKKIIESWTNFAKDGVPSSKWNKFSNSDPYVQKFYVHHKKNKYLQQHLANCEFFRPYFEFDL